MELMHRKKRVNFAVGVALYLQLVLGSSAPTCPAKCSPNCQFGSQGEMTEAKCTDIHIPTLPNSLLRLEVSDAAEWEVPPFGKFEDYMLAGKTELQSLIIKNYKIIRLDGEPFRISQELRLLDLSNNLIEEISQENFVGLGKLLYLSLNQNKLQIIGNYSFTHLSSLTELHIVQNNIHNIGEKDFSGLVNIEKVDLQFNHIAHINPNAFQTIQTLEDINLNHNALTGLEAGVFANLMHLKSVNLQANFLHYLDPASMMGTSLVVLKLYQNELTQVPTKFLREVSNRNLTVNLAKNNITEIPAGAFDGVILDTLYLVANQIHQIDGDALQNSFIKMLDLQQNLLEHFPESLESSLNQSNTVLLANNPWSCDCDIQWVKVLLKGSANQEPTCTKPINYGGSKLSDVIKDLKLICNENITSLPVPTKVLQVPPRHIYITPKLDKQPSETTPQTTTATTAYISTPLMTKSEGKSLDITGIVCGVIIGVVSLAVIIILALKVLVFQTKVWPDPVLLVNREELNFKPYMKYAPQENIWTVDV